MDSQQSLHALDFNTTKSMTCWAYRQVWKPLKLIFYDFHCTESNTNLLENKFMFPNICEIYGNIS